MPLPLRFSALILAVAGLAAIPAPAFAETTEAAKPAEAITCDDAMAGRIVATVRGLRVEWSPERAAAIQNVAKACPENPNIQLGYAVMLNEYAQRSSTAKEDRLAAWSANWETFASIDASGKSPQDFEARSAVNVGLITLLLNYANSNGGNSIPAFAKPEPLARCPYYASQMAQQLWYPFKRQTNWTGLAPAFLKKLAEACRDKVNDLDRYPVLFYGQYLMGMAERSTDPKQKLALASEALPWLAPSPKPPTSNKADVEKLLRRKAEMESELGALPDVTQKDFWKGSDQLDEYRRAVIGFRADAVWGAYLSVNSETASTEEKRAPLRAYRDFVMALEKVALSAGPQASKVLYEGLDGHADGTYRSAAFKDRTGPPEVLRHLTDPDRPKK